MAVIDLRFRRKTPDVPSYLICGLRVDSDRALPGAIPCEGREIDVTFAAGDVPERLEAATARHTFWEYSDEAFLWRMPGLGGFVARRGTELFAQPSPGVEMEDLLPFVLGTGLGAVLYQRGAVVLHASAVAFEGRAYALCGASGAGKSTLAAALCKAGAEFLSDDVTQITLDESERPLVHADGRRLKLTPRSIARLDLAGGQGAAVRSDIEKYYVAPPRHGGESRPLSGIYFLDFDRLAAAPRITGMARLAGAQKLLEESYRPRMAMALMRPDQAPRITAALLRGCGLFSLTRPDALDRLDESVTRLLDHWREVAA